MMLLHKLACTIINKPMAPPEVRTKEFRVFQKEVQLILQVMNENEYQAATI